MRLNEFTEQNVEEGMMGNSDSPVAQAIIRRILIQRTDLLAKYGPGYVGQAVDDVADSVGDWDEIGSSDVSGWVRQVEHNLKNKLNQYDEPMNVGDALDEQAVAEGAPELLKAEMPLVRHIEQKLTNIGYKKGTPEFNAYFNDAIKFYRQFGNFGFNKEQSVAEGDPGYDKHSFIGKIRRSREADNKGWGQLGQQFAANSEEEYRKALRKGNRYYNMTRGDNKTPGGFPKTTIDEQGVAEGELATYSVNVMDPITGEHWRIEVKVTSPEMAKERAEAMGYKVLRVNEKQGVAEVSSNTLKRYKKAAQRDIDTTDNAGLYTDSDIDRMGRRMKGIDQATSKINANKRKEQGVAEGSEQIYKILALDKGNALKKPTKLKWKASSLEDIFDALAAQDWYPLEINGIEVIAGKRLKQGVAEAGNGRPGTTPGFQDTLTADEKRRAQRAAERQAQDKSTKSGIDKNRAKADAYRKSGVAEAGYGKATGRAAWDSNMPGYQGDYGGASNWGRRHREDDEHHEIDRRIEQEHEYRNTYGTWYVRIDGLVEPTPYKGKAAANAAALELKKQPGNENKVIMLTMKEQ